MEQQTDTQRIPQAEPGTPAAAPPSSGEAPSKKRYDVDMTQGNIFRHLLTFSLPLLAGNLFQQMYNMVDAWVVGTYVSNEAFSAVGTVSPIINTLIGAFTGLASGAGVVISQYYGAKREDKVHDAVHTCLVMTLLLGVVFTALGIAMTPAMLRLMKTPAEVFPQSATYLTIYFSGMMALMIYNMGSGILRAVGDSRRPFYFLLACALTNTVLDLAFVLGLGMGVEGVAYATVIAEIISALLVMAVLLRADSCIRVTLRHLKLHLDLLAQMVKVGIPAALQMAVTSFSNVFVQSYINYFGPDCMGGWTAYTKIDQLLFLPMQSLAMGATTFVGQNLGMGLESRARKGVRTSLAMAVAATLVSSAVVLLTAPYLVAFFNNKPEVVRFGALFLRRITPFYVLCCVNQIYSGALRGAGNSRAPMLIMLGSFVLFRQAYLFVMANYIANEVLPIAMGYPAGWLVCSALTLFYYSRVRLSRTSLAVPPEASPGSKPSP